MFEFKPSSNYDLLLFQAKSMARLIRSMELQIEILNARIENLSNDVSIGRKEEIDSLRETNESLTNYIEELENRL